MNTFKKVERLNSKKLIDQIFTSGKSAFVFPFKLYFIPINDELAPAIQLAVSVPKKHFKKAVDRNLLKRRIKEAYRLNKHHYISQLSRTNRKYGIVIVYLEKEILLYKDIEEKINRVFQRFIDLNEEDN